MNKTTINVPPGIRYISEWEEFRLPEQPTIINKQITGCGFTEYCIIGNFNVILVSPRKILLENKESQHPTEVFYLKNDSDKALDVDKDLNKDDIKAGLAEDKIYTEEELKVLRDHIAQMKDEVISYYYNTITTGRPCKILVTYDSFRHVKEALGDKIKDFYVVVDEFQSIFTDSRFKSDTELEFLNFLKDISRLCFVSATPMMDEYLEMLDEFRDLPYIDMDWGALDPNRVIRPELSVKPCQSILPIAENIIRTYQEGNFQKYTYLDDQGNIQEIESRELVVYVNSVKNICDIIRRCGLKYEETNVLCSNTLENQKKIRKAFGLGRSQEGGIGKVPKRGEFHKMFTLCTRTVYLGADFYSLCARSLILSDANIECLAVDITLDLPQILGRQRLLENPWKNRAELYFKSVVKSETFEQLTQRLNIKKEKTENLLLAYSQVQNSNAKHDLAEKYQRGAKSENYRNDYISVNTRGGKDMFPVFNNLVMISEIRAYEIQQIDYKDRFTVVNQIKSSGVDFRVSGLDEFLINFDNLTKFTDKMRFLCDYSYTISNINDLNYILSSIDMIYKNYFTVLGRDKIKSLSYQKSKLKLEYERLKDVQTGENILLERIYSDFLENQRYVIQYVKQKLGNIYKDLKLSITPKATDIENYFEVKKIQIINKETGKKDRGYLIIKKKE